MRTFGLIVLALFTAIIQIALHGLGSSIVVPNLCLILLIWLAPRIATGLLAGLALTMGLVIEQASGLSFGSVVLGLLLVVFVAKLIFNEADERRLSFQLGLMVGSTLLIVGIAVASLPLADLAAHWPQLVWRTVLECLYNCGILVGITVLTSGEQPTSDRRYHLPKI